jgi:hypothetical protein
MMSSGIAAAIIVLARIIQSYERPQRRDTVVANQVEATVTRMSMIEGTIRGAMRSRQTLPVAGMPSVVAISTQHVQEGENMRHMAGQLVMSVETAQARVRMKQRVEAAMVHLIDMDVQLFISAAILFFLFFLAQPSRKHLVVIVVIIIVSPAAVATPVPVMSSRTTGMRFVVVVMVFAVVVVVMRRFVMLRWRLMVDNRPWRFVMDDQRRRGGDFPDGLAIRPDAGSLIVNRLISQARVGAG